MTVLTDKTAEVARRFASKEVVVISREKGGAAAARNCALQLSQGDYIQWLDADDLLAPDKIARQLAKQREISDTRILLSAPWGYFSYRPRRARFVPTALWENLSPVEWLLRKDVRESPHAKRDMACESRTGGRRPALGTQRPHL